MPETQRPAAAPGAPASTPEASGEADDARGRETGMWRLRVRDDATGYGNYYFNHRGELMGAPFDTKQDAEDVRRAMPNGAEFDVVEVRDA